MKIFRLIVNQIKSKVLYRYLIAYFLVLILPFGIGCFYYSNTLKILEKNIISDNNAYLKQASASLDQRLSEVASIAHQITLSQSVQKFQRITKPFEYPNTYSVLELRKDLSNYAPSNKFITNYFVFFHQSQLVVNQEMVYTYEDFYTHYFAPAYENYEEWEKEVHSLKGQQALDITLTPSPKSMGVYYIPAGEYIFFCTPFYSYGVQDGFTAIAINKEEILKLLKYDSNTDGFSYIQDRNNQVVFSTSENNEDIAQIQNAINLESNENDNFVEAQILGEEMLISSMYGENSGYRFISVQPKETVFSKANSQKQMLLSILLISIALSVVISYLLAKNTYKPLKQILANISAQNSQEDVFVAIKDSFSSLVKKNSSLQSTLEKQVDLLHDSFLSKLINREFTTPNDIDTMCEVLRFNKKEKVYALLTFQCDVNIQNYDAIDLTIVSSIMGLLKEQFYIHLDNPYLYTTSHQLVLLLYYNDKTTLLNKANEIVLKLKESCPKQIYSQILISGSSCVDSLEDIPECLQQTQLAFKINNNEVNSEILWYKPTDTQINSYKFTLEEKNKLIYFCKLGKEEETKNMMHNIFTENLVENSISLGYQKIFIYELLSVIITVLNSVDIQEEEKKIILDEIENFEQKNELYQIKFISGTISQLCKIPKITKLRSDSLNDILDYINKNYSDPNLSLTTIASNFKLNESYLSYTFKQQTDQKFFTYVEQMRIEKAKLQLQDPQNSIAQIAQNVGYLSANSFCRAFKRVTGENTTTYRNNNK